VRRLAALWVLCAAAVAWQPAWAAMFGACDRATDLSARQQDALLRFGDAIKAELGRSGRGVALLSRSGTDLSRFGLRYSHAGLSVRSGLDTPWAVRQLYFACDEHRSRLFDQGMAAFVMGTREPDIGYVSAVFLPVDESLALERSARDTTLALQMLGPDYSANAYPFSPRYQNCNQWVAELMAAALGDLPRSTDARGQSQQWLLAHGYRPTLFDVQPRVLMGLVPLLPALHDDDHPPADLELGVFRVSMPAALEDFVRQSLPQAERVEFCHTAHHVVVHHGWSALPEGCEPTDGDAVLPLD
jgi:hypothetical protein